MKSKSFTIKSLLVAAVALSGGLALTSCEDTLEKPSFTADDIDYVFSDVQKSELFVKGVYRNFAVEELYRACNTGETVTTANEELWIQANMPRANYKFDPYNPWVFGSVYSTSYSAIENCNLGLKYISKLEDSPKRNALMAELYFLRANAYHNLIRFLGDVPTQWTAVEDCNLDDILYPTRQPRDEIYDRIIKDMVDHVDDLPWQSENPYVTNERLTRNAGLGILARICLHAAGYSLRWDLETNDPATLKMARRDDDARVREIYDIADKALAQVIAKGDNHLVRNTESMSGFMYLFNNFSAGNYGPTAPEIMWMIAQQGKDTNGRLGNYIGQPGAGQGSFFGSKKALQVKLPVYYLSFDPADTRRDVTCPMYTIGRSGNEDIHVGTTYSSVMGGKYRIQWSQQPYDTSNKSNMDMIMLRYSDILLMYAETQNFLYGPNDAAKAALQEVRDRAGIGSMPIAAANKDEFLETIMQERKWELADEYLLRTDLVRTNLLDSHLKADKQAHFDLSDKTGKYANVPQYRIYHKSVNEGVYGDKFLMVEYFDLTDPSEIATITTMPLPTMVVQANRIRQAIKNIVETHGHTYNNDWYPVRMFEHVTSDYNARARQICSYIVVTTFGLGNVCGCPTGSAENGGTYPTWVDGEYGLYYGYKQNFSELSPLAGKIAGHPLFDNPNLTQLPGYPGAFTEF